MRASPLGLVVVAATLACSDVIGGVRGEPSAGGAPPTGNPVDVLFVVDGSPGMRESQRVLAASTRDFLVELTNPSCVDVGGAHEERPASPDDPCPEGLARRYEPVRSLHVGVISSNLGTFGDGPCDPGGAVFGDDHGRLVTRGAEAAGLGDRVSQGFAVYGEGGISQSDELVAVTQALVTGVGEEGCPFPMTLESMTRFLVDPAPPESFAEMNGIVTGIGLDQLVLEQRRRFLRDGAILAIVVLAPRNDCSIAPGRRGGFFSRAPGDMARGTATCDDDPGDACCHPCDEAPPSGCSIDLSCTSTPKVAPEDDPIGMRCAAEKRRFGRSFVYPVARYENALQLAVIDRASPDLFPRGNEFEPNPLYAGGRTRARLALGVVTGVHWQRIAVDPARLVDGFRSVAQLLNDGSIDAIAGNPDRAVDPTDPFSIESASPRAGVPDDNALNGGDRPGATSPQYACTSLAGALEESSICQSPDSLRVCNGAVQIASFAAPGTRLLRLAAGVASPVALGTACAPESIDAAAYTFGYRQMLDALLDRMVPSLAEPSYATFP